MTMALGPSQNNSSHMLHDACNMHADLNARACMGLLDEPIVKAACISDRLGFFLFFFWPRYVGDPSSLTFGF